MNIGGSVDRAVEEAESHNNVRDADRTRLLATRHTIGAGLASLANLAIGVYTIWDSGAWAGPQAIPTLGILAGSLYLFPRNATNIRNLINLELVGTNPITSKNKKEREPVRHAAKKVIAEQKRHQGYVLVPAALAALGINIGFAIANPPGHKKSIEESSKDGGKANDSYDTDIAAAAILNFTLAIYFATRFVQSGVENIYANELKSAHGRDDAVRDLQIAQGQAHKRMAVYQTTAEESEYNPLVATAVDLAPRVDHVEQQLARLAEFAGMVQMPEEERNRVAAKIAGFRRFVAEYKPYVQQSLEAKPAPIPDVPEWANDTQGVMQQSANYLEELTANKSYWDDLHNKIGQVQGTLNYMRESVLPHTQDIWDRIQEHMTDLTPGDSAHALAMETDSLIAQLLSKHSAGDDRAKDLAALGEHRNGLIADAQIIRVEMRKAAEEAAAAEAAAAANRNNGKESKAKGKEVAKESAALAQARIRFENAARDINEIRSRYEE